VQLRLGRLNNKNQQKGVDARPCARMLVRASDGAGDHVLGLSGSFGPFALIAALDPIDCLTRFVGFGAWERMWRSGFVR
jgi:hypothetical protein